MLVLLAPLSRGVLGSECLDADHSRAARAAINMPLGLDAVADHPPTTVLEHRRHLVDPHSKLSNVCLAPAATTSNAMSYSFPQTSHVPIGLLLSRMQTDLVAVLHRMLNAPPAARPAVPHTRAYLAREIFVHEPRDVLHGLVAAEDERPAPVGRA